MRILLDARTIQDRFPGIGRYVYNLALALAPQLDGELLLFVNHALSNTQYPIPTLAAYPNVRLIPTDIPIRHWREQTRLPGLIRSLAPDLVHFPYYVRPYRLGIPTILTLYDVIPRRFPHYFSRATAHSVELLKRLAIRSSDAFVAISQATSADFQAFYDIPAGRITVTPLAPDPIFQPQAPAAIADLRRRLALPERYALYLGSNKPHKNLPRLVEAWAQVVGSREQGARGRGQGAGSRQISNTQYSIPKHDAKSPTMYLVIAGAWDERYPEAKHLAESLHVSDSVHFLGPVPNADLPTLYAGAELFVFPSLYEGFGLPVLEAMACGTPVACSNASSLPEVTGDAAVLFDPEDVDEMAATMQQVLGDQALRRELSETGRAQAARFTWEHTAQKTLRGYRSILQTR